MKTLFKIALGLVLLTAPKLLLAAADLDPDNLLTSITNEFIFTAKEQSEPLKQASRRLFYILMPISLSLMGIRFVITQRSLNELFYEFVEFALFCGLFLFVLDNVEEITSSIIDSFTSLTSISAKGPSELFDLTINLVALCQDHIGLYSSGMVYKLLCFALLYGFAVIMFIVILRFCVMLVEAKVLCIAGVLTLGFGAFIKTYTLPVNYLMKVLSCAMQLMTLLLIINTSCTVLKRVFDKTQSIFDNGGNLTSQMCVVVIFISLFLYLLSNQVPSMVGTLFYNAVKSAKESEYIKNKFKLK